MGLWAPPQPARGGVEGQGRQEHLYVELVQLSLCVYMTVGKGRLLERALLHGRGQAATVGVPSWWACIVLGVSAGWRQWCCAVH